MRAFLKGDSTILSAASELQKYASVPSFAAPKRIAKKLNPSTQRPRSKIIDENEYPSSHCTADAKSQEKSKDGQWHIKTAKPLSVLQPSHNRVRSEYKSPQNDTNDDLHQIKVSNRNINLKQMATQRYFEGKDEKGSYSMRQNTDEMVVSLVEEVDRLNQLLLEKINENEELKLLNVSLEKKLQECLLQETNEDYLNGEVYKKNFLEANRLDTRVRSFTQATLNTEEDSKENYKDMNRTFTSVGKPKYAKKVHLVSNSLSGMERIKGLGHPAQEKSKLEELNILLTKMNSTLKAKEGENEALRSEIGQLNRNYEMMDQKILQYQQVTEKLRTELMNSHAQNQDLSHKLASMKSHHESPKTKGSKFAKSSFPNQESSEWQQKYEFTKKDNDKLIKMVEENQKVIQSFRGIFIELEKRHNINYDALKGEYEQRLKGFIEGK